MQDHAVRRRTLPPAPAGTPLGDRLRTLRASRGLSVAALARRSRVPFARIYGAEYRDGFTGFSETEATALAHALGLDTVAQLTGEGGDHDDAA